VPLDGQALERLAARTEGWRASVRIV